MGQGIINLLGVIKKSYAFYSCKWFNDQSFLDLFQQMFQMHPGKRISPEEILEHDFLSSQYEYDLNSYGNTGAAAAAADKEDTDPDDVDKEGSRGDMIWYMKNQASMDGSDKKKEEWEDERENVGYAE